MASDGLWDVVSNKEAVEIVLERYLYILRLCAGHSGAREDTVALEIMLV